MNKHRPEIPILIMGFIFIAAGIYVFAVNEIVIQSKFTSAYKGSEISGLAQLIIAFFLFFGGFLLIWTKGKW